MDEKETAIGAIRKKLLGKTLSYKEIYAVMDEIASDRLGDILTAYFVAGGISKGFSNEEVCFLTRAMVATGETLHFSGIVADKHSIGGIPGGRTTLVVVPIIAACGFTIPKSSSRAITTPSGTADAMEVLAPVTFTKEEIYKIVGKTHGCIVWGGSFKIAPADDEIIRVEEPLRFESFDKILVSVVAKKVAFGSTHVVIDIPYGRGAKVHTLQDAVMLKEKFEYLAEKFHMKIKVIVHKMEEPAGRGIGPLLEVRDALMVLEQKEDRPQAFEEQALHLAGALLSLCLADSNDLLKNEIEAKYRTTKEWAKESLVSGRALLKMREIIEAQGGYPNIHSHHLVPGKHRMSVRAHKGGIAMSINHTYLTSIAKILGAPHDKRAGIYLHKKNGARVEKGEAVCSLYSQSIHRLKEAHASLDIFPLFDIR